MDLKYFVIDFDSTFVKLEGLDVLAKVSLKNSPEKIAEIESITRDGMTGKIGFRESLELRIKGLELRIMRLIIVARTKIIIIAADLAGKWSISARD